jgi:integrase
VCHKTYTPLKTARNRDAQIVAHFLPHFGAKRLDEITKSDIVRYLNLRRTQMTGNPGHKNRRLVSECTVRRERGLLQSIFERAIDEGYDIRNPFRGVKRGKDKPRTRVLTLDEETRLLEALHPRFQRFVRFALGTGCRLDEIRGIDSTRDRDWMRGTVHVIGKFRKERDVPMQPDARAALEEQLQEDGKLWRQNPQRLREVLAEGSASCPGRFRAAQHRSGASSVGRADHRRRERKLSSDARLVARGSRLRRPLLRGRGVRGVLPCRDHFVLAAGDRNRNGRSGHGEVAASAVRRQRACRRGPPHDAARTEYQRTRAQPAGACHKGEQDRQRPPHSITADTALRLARYFAMTPYFWMNLQAAYDLDVATRASADRIRRDVYPRGAV